LQENGCHSLGAGYNWWQDADGFSVLQAHGIKLIMKEVASTLPRRLSVTRRCIMEENVDLAKATLLKRAIKEANRSFQFLVGGANRIHISIARRSAG